MEENHRMAMRMSLDVDSGPYHKEYANVTPRHDLIGHLTLDARGSTSDTYKVSWFNWFPRQRQYTSTVMDVPHLFSRKHYVRGIGSPYDVLAAEIWTAEPPDCPSCHDDGGIGEGRYKRKNVFKFNRIKKRLSLSSTYTYMPLSDGWEGNIRIPKIKSDTIWLVLKSPPLFPY